MTVEQFGIRNTIFLILHVFKNFVNFEEQQMCICVIIGKGKNVKLKKVVENEFKKYE